MSLFKTLHIVELKVYELHVLEMTANGGKLHVKAAVPKGKRSAFIAHQEIKSTAKQSQFRV